MQTESVDFSIDIHAGRTTDTRSTPRKDAGTQTGNVFRTVRFAEPKNLQTAFEISRALGRDPDKQLRADLFQSTLHSPNRNRNRNRAFGVLRLRQEKLVCAAAGDRLGCVVGPDGCESLFGFSPFSRGKISALGTGVPHLVYATVSCLFLLGI